MDKKFGCDLCTKFFSHLCNVKKHKRTIHGIVTPVNEQKEKKKKFQCNICQKKFLFPAHVIRHIKTVHKNRNAVTSRFPPIKKHKCEICNRLLSTAFDMRRHQRTLHNINIEISRKEKIKCTECSALFTGKSSFNKHFVIKHPDINIKEEKLTFQSEEQFVNWKTQMEKDTASFYAAYANKRTSSRLIQYFECNHSGHYKGRGTGKRNLKTLGSIKMGSECPARIRKQTDSSPNGQVHIDVTFYSTHVGHQCEAGRLRFSKLEKAEIARRLRAGVPPKYIIENLTYNSSPTERIGLTKLKDIHNISTSYGIDMRVDKWQSYVLSVDRWVKKMMASKENSILIYKNVGEISILYPNLTTNDFVLGFMNCAQEQIYKLYGSEVFSIDSTHGTNKYNVQLTSIVVADNNWEEFPVAFLWSNLQTEDVFIYFYNAIKERVGVMNTKTFISDGYPAFYNAFTTVFGPAKFNFICDWHVKQSWTKDLSTGPHKIEKIEKRQEVINALFDMVSETDENTFKCLIETNTKKLMEDPDTANFGKYFLSNYVNRSKQWAGCFQNEAKMNRDISVERWHKELQYNSGVTGEKVGPLDKAILNLINSLRKKLVDKMATIPREKLIPKLTTLHKTHTVVESTAKEIVLLETNGKWTVPSISNLGAFYTIKHCDISPNHSCNLICQLCHACIHEFHCSCNDSSIKLNFCKHIHLVCIKGRVKMGHTSIESSTNNGDLVLLLDQMHNYAMEQMVVTKKSKEGELDELQSARAEICSEILSLFPVVNDDTIGKEEFREIQKFIIILKHKLELMSQKSAVLRQFVNKSAPV